METTDLFDCRSVIHFIAKKCASGMQEGIDGDKCTPPSVGRQALAYMPGSRIRLRTPRRERSEESKWKNMIDSIVRLGLGIYGRLESLEMINVATSGEMTIADKANEVMPRNQLRWFQKILSFRNELAKMAMDENFHFTSLVVSPIRKSDSEDRIIAKFTDLHEAALLACLVKYLTEIFDPYLMDCACAFRAGGKGGFNDAAKQIRDFRMRHSSGPLFVAECDLKKFYDTVNHDCLRMAYKTFSGRANKDGVRIDERADKLLDAYLKCYSFKGSVFGSDDKRMRKAIKANRIPWVDKSGLESIYSGKDIPFDKIGIPQGGAISPLLANIFLHSIDCAVRYEDGADVFGSEFLYTRFCDDMVIISSDRRECEAAFFRYCDKAKELKLLMHPPKNGADKYCAKWWDGKTRAPYEWSKDAIPWVGFVGYQIRYDGEFRLRRQSLERINKRIGSEIGNALHEANDIVNSADSEKSCRWAELLELKDKTISHITKRLAGRADLRFGRGGRMRQYCWADSFSLIADSFDESGIARKQIGVFDRLRNGWINWFVRKINAMLPESLRSHNVYWGRPFSIFDAFTAERNRLRRGRRVANGGMAGYRSV